MTGVSPASSIVWCAPRCFADIGSHTARTVESLSVNIGFTQCLNPLANPMAGVVASKLDPMKCAELPRRHRLSDALNRRKPGRTSRLSEYVNWLVNPMAGAIASNAFLLAKSVSAPSARRRRLSPTALRPTGIAYDFSNKRHGKTLNNMDRNTEKR